jgi:hypothetical protein
MKSTVARIVLSLLLLSTVAVRVHALQSRDTMVASFDIDAAIKSLIRENGFPLRENPAKPPSILSVAVYFQRQECAAPSVVVPFDLNFEALPLLARVAPPQNYTHSFFYLDGTWPEQDRVRIFGEWLRHAVLNLAGATPFLPIKTAVVVAEPAACQASVRLDWRGIWERARIQTRIENGLHREDGGEAPERFHVHS